MSIMARNYYKLDVVTRAMWGRNPLSATRLTWRILRTRLLYDWRHVYGMAPSEANRVVVPEIPGYRIECLSSEQEAERLDAELRDYPELLPDDPLRLQAMGALFWVGRMDGQLASLGASRRGAPTGHYFFPVLPSCVVLSHFATMPQFRGRGLYPALLSHILHQMAPWQVDYFLIDCCDWNIGSQRGIERAGFRHIGYGKATRTGRLSWHPLKPPRVEASRRPGRRPVQSEIEREAVRT